MSTGIGAAKSSDICSVGLKTSVWRCRCCLQLRVAGFCVLDIAVLSFFCFGSDALFGVASLGGASVVVSATAIVVSVTAHNDSKSRICIACILCYSAYRAILKPKSSRPSIP